MTGPLTIDESLERAARKADELGMEFGAASSRSRILNEEESAAFARLSLLMYEAAEILRAARDRNEPLREEMLR
jgi:hypothetical protein